jgi:hypothetical protein
MMHVHCMPDNTLRTCNTYCFSVAGVVTETHFNIPLYVHCLFVLLGVDSSSAPQGVFSCTV